MKKAFGIILIIIASLLSLSVLSTLPKTIRIITAASQNNSGYGWGYVLGTLSSTLFFIVLIIFIFRFGIRFLKK